MSNKQDYARDLTGRLAGYHQNSHLGARHLYSLLQNLPAWREAIGKQILALQSAGDGMGAALGSFDKMPDEKPDPDPGPVDPSWGTLADYGTDADMVSLPAGVDPAWQGTPRKVAELIASPFAWSVEPISGYTVVRPNPDAPFRVRAGEKMCIPQGHIMRAPIKVYEGGFLQMLGSCHVNGQRYALQGYQGSWVEVAGGGAFSGADSAAMLLADGRIDGCLVQRTGGDGVKISNSQQNFVVQRLYVRHLGLEEFNYDGQTAAELHVDAIQKSSGSQALEVLDSVLDVRPGVWAQEVQGGGNAGVMCRSTFGPVGKTVLGRVLILGGNYGVYQRKTSPTRTEQYPIGDLELSQVRLSGQRFGSVNLDSSLTEQDVDFL